MQIGAIKNYRTHILRAPDILITDNEFLPPPAPPPHTLFQRLPKLEMTGSLQRCLEFFSFSCLEEEEISFYKEW